MKKGILFFLIPLMFSCSITSRTYTVQFANQGGTIVPELKKSYKAGSKIKSPYEIDLQAAKSLFTDDRQAVKWEIMVKADDGSYKETNLFFNPEVDVVVCDLVLKATSEGDKDFAYTINFKDKSGNLMFTKTVPVGQKIEYTDEEKAKLKTAGSNIFFGEDWKVINSTDDTKSDFSISTKLTKDTFAVENINEVDLQPGDWDVQENFKCFAECTWDEIVNVIHGKTRSGRATAWATSDYPTGYARLLFDNVNLPQLESSNREGGTNMAGGANVRTPHNCFSSGCQKLVHIGKAGTQSADDEDDYFVNMIGFDHDVISSTISGSGDTATAKKAPLTLQMVGSLKTGHRFDDEKSVVDNGWYTENNELRITLNNIANGYIPTATDRSSTFKVARCKKGSANKTKECNASLDVSDDYLWVPDGNEIVGFSAGLGAYTSVSANYAYVWYDNTRELNPSATTHSFTNTSPINKYFLRVSDNNDAHAPWYSVAWDRWNRKYVANPRGVFEGDRAGFKGFTGTVDHKQKQSSDEDDRAYGTSAGFQISSGITGFNTALVGTSQYEYWARFQTETPIGATDPRYKGDRTVGNDAGLYTSKKPSMNKYVHFKKSGGTEAVTGADKSANWVCRTPQISSTVQCSFCYLCNMTGYQVSSSNYKIPTSFMFAIE